MTKDDVRVLADEILKPILGPAGFTSSDVEERENHAGEDALYVTVHMTPDAKVATGDIYTDATMAMLDALVERGDRRFAYLKYDFPGDPAPSADGDDENGD